MITDLETKRKIWNIRRTRKKYRRYLRLLFASLPLLFFLQYSNNITYMPIKTEAITKTNIVAHNTIRLKETITPESVLKDSSKLKNTIKKKQETIDESYFDDALFIGDSRTQGLAAFSGLTNATFYAEKGLNVKTAFEHKLVKLNNQTVTIPTALKKQSFGKVYIMFGVNELGWIYENVFIDYYESLIDQIKKLQPNAEIYIQSIIHVSKDREKKQPELNNKKINRRNQLLKELAKEKKVHYLNLNEVLTNKGGALFANAATDGIHLNKTYCTIWKNYLMKHTADSDNTTIENISKNVKKEPKKNKNSSKKDNITKKIDTNKTDSKDKKADSINQNIGSIPKKTDSSNGNTKSIPKKVDSSNRNTKSVPKKADSFNKKTEAINNNINEPDLSKKFTPGKNPAKEKISENNKVFKNKPKQKDLKKNKTKENKQKSNKII